MDGNYFGDTVSQKITAAPQQVREAFYPTSSLNIENLWTLC